MTATASARAALVANINPDMEVGIGLASGSSDPVSSNQTLGDAGSTKDIGLDLAYFDWTGLANTHVMGGKFKQIIYTSGRNQLLWDSDWRPEGAGIRWEGETFFASGLGTWIEGDSSRDTEFSWYTLAGMQLELGSAELKFGASYHEIDTSGRGSFMNNGNFFGNSFDPLTGTYLYNYEGLQAFAELRAKLLQIPFMVYAEYVQNQDAPEFDTGYIVGMKLGSAKAPGSWELGLAWEDLGADAVFGLLTDSDFGRGGTDAEGMFINGGYAIRDNMVANFTVYLTEVGGDRGMARDLNELFLDLNFKF